MPLTDGRITFDVEARLVGYQEQIDKMKAALAKIDPFSSIGKSLEKMVSNAEHKFNNLSKNSKIEIGSQESLYKLFGRFEDLDSLLIKIGDTFRSIGNEDLAKNLGPEVQQKLEAMRQAAEAFETAYSDAFRQAINNSSSLSKVLRDLGADLTQITEGQATELLSEGFIEASKAAKEAEAQAKKFGDQIATINANMAAMREKATLKDSIISGVTSAFGASKKTGLDQKFIIDQYTAAAGQMLGGSQGQLRKAYLDVLRDSGDFRISGRKGDEKLSFSGSVQSAEELLQRLQAIRQEFVKINQENRKLATESGGSRAPMLDHIISGFKQDIKNPKGVSLEGLKSSVSELMSSANTTVSDRTKVLTFIDQGQLDKGLQTALNSIREAYNKLESEIQDGQKRLGELQSGQAGADASLNAANAQAAAIQQAQENIAAAKTAASAQSVAAEDRAREATEAYNDALAKNLRLVQEAGQGGGDFGRGKIDESKSALQVYNAELERAKNTQQLVSSIQGFVQRWFSVYAAVRMVRQAINSIKTTLKDLDQIITNIAIVTDQTQGDLWNRMGEYTNLAIKFGASIKGVYEVSQLYYQQGLETADVMVLTEETLKMARISGLEYADATNYMTNAIRSFKMEMTDAQRIVDVYSALAASSATSTAELASAMSKTASSAQSVGASFENTTAMMAVMIETTREAPENFSGACKKI